jgi:general secretion pathway protein A
MYEQFFSLRERAFDLSLNPRYFLLMPTHREALANVEYAIQTKQGITLLLGDAGMGKTMVLRRALANNAQRGNERTLVYIGNPALTRTEFFECLADGFELASDTATSKTRFLRELERRLRDQRARGQAYVLVIDEAQAIPDELLEEIRLLRNIAMDVELLPLILAGQPELAGRLGQSHLRQLKQRIALRCVLGSLNLNETANYIAGRIRLAGGDPSILFSREAVLAIHEYSRGIPRSISVICENALLGGFANGRRRISADLVAEVSRDLDFPGSRHEQSGPVNDAETGGIETFRAPGPARVARAGDRNDVGHTSEISRLRQLLTTRSRPQ